MSSDPGKRDRCSVAVVIPLYNKAEYIARALDSVFAQTFQDFEIIVVDDGSTDEGPGIVSGYSDPRLRLIHQNNAGPGVARNRGLAESTAGLVSFLDADDEWLPDFLADSTRRLRDNPDCAATISGYYRGAERKDMEPQLRELGITEGPWRLPTSLSVGQMRVAIHSFLTPAVLCRRGVVERFGGFYDKDRCTYGEDMYLWLQIALNCRVHRTPRPLVWYHSEASELGLAGRKTVPPAPPMTTDGERILRACPPEYRSLLDRFLAYQALQTARRHARVGRTATAKWALTTFPAMRSLGIDYRRLRREMLLAPLVRLARSALRLVCWRRRRRSIE